jgi:hypothetical protein
LRPYGGVISTRGNIVEEKIPYPMAQRGREQLKIIPLIHDPKEALQFHPLAQILSR